MHDASSRSHAILRIYVRRRKNSAAAAGNDVLDSSGNASRNARWGNGGNKNVADSNGERVIDDRDGEFEGKYSKRRRSKCSCNYR